MKYPIEPEYREMKAYIDAGPDHWDEKIKVFETYSTEYSIHPCPFCGTIVLGETDLVEEEIKALKGFIEGTLSNDEVDTLFQSGEDLDEDLDEMEYSDPNPCTHLLFVATDYGWEYQSDRFLEMLENLKTDAEEDDYEDFDNLSDQLNQVVLPGSIMLEVITPAPGSLCAYIGYGPSQD